MSENAREQARLQFGALLASNANYFGNIKESTSEPVISIISDTTFEKLVCVGLQPSLNKLEAVIYINKETGYYGDVCSDGSREYVRFYISTDDGATWLDQGMVSFPVYSIPGEKPLEYAVTLDINPKKFFCFKANLPKVRAILSWNNPPPADTPDFDPIWGNKIEARIQIEALKIFLLEEMFLQANLQVPEYFKDNLDLQQELAVAEPKTLTISELHQLYKKQDVPTHRYVFSQLQNLIKSPSQTEYYTSKSKNFLQNLNVDAKEVINTLLNTNGNVTFEQLDCIGLDSNRDALAGVISVKLSSGYSGGLCTAGSREYVSFWVDWADGLGWIYAGTASVRVHDISKIPSEHLKYAVYLPVEDLPMHLQDCKKGPKTVRVRAILSWQAPPPPWNPDYKPTWGNRLETLVHIRPGEPYNIGTPNISIIGGVGRADINVFGNGMSKPGATFALTGFKTDPWLDVRECPFGGRVAVIGYPSVGYKYRVYVRTGASPPAIVSTPIRTVDLNGIGTWRLPDSTGFFTYLPTSDNIINLLAWWDTSGDEMWEMRLEIANSADVVLGSTPWYRIQLDNTLPDPVEIHIDSGGDCKSFPVKTPISGHFIARDINFGAFQISVSPFGAPPGSLSPTSGTSQTNSSPGDVWSLDTTHLEPCGYNVWLTAYDLTNHNSESGKRHKSAPVGFCILVS